LNLGAAAAVEQHAITIWSQGAPLQGNIFKPAAITERRTLPGILLIPGWGGSRANLNRTYAPQFADRGYLGLTFDFRSWGDSDGFLLLDEALPAAEGAAAVTVSGRQERLIVNPLAMLEDARAALAYLVGEPQVQADNIGVWGTSLGGGLALVTAAGDSRVKALVSQIGALDNLANFSMIPKEQALAWETLRARGEIAPYPGAESTTGELKGFPDLANFMRYDPAAYWDNIKVPTLVIDAEDEELFDRSKNGQALYKSLKDRVASQYLVLPGKHYAVYRDDGYRKALKAAQDWFMLHLK